MFYKKKQALSPQAILQQYWGYQNFRPLQQEIIEHVVGGHDTLALLPTGGGKSICFQVPALALEGVTLVVSPLIALMKDQVRQLRDRGIIADAIYSGMRAADIDRVLDNAVYGNTKLLYLSPERLKTQLAIERIRKMPLALIAVDEAHCISQWGYDFRPPYLEIADIRQYHPEVPIIAVTATATPEVVEDIQQKLTFKAGSQVFQQSFVRDNLTYVIRKSESKEQEMLKILKGVPGSSIIYVRSRRLTQLIAEQLRRRNISATAYHAGLSHEDRDKRQAAWIAGEARVVVATNAFGMGIDKPNVRSVIHYDLPDSPEAYFQEAGRGGRDGRPSYAVVLYQEEDTQRLQEQHEIAYPALKEVRRVYRALGSYLQLATGSGKDESYDFDLADFSATFSLQARPTYFCLRILEKAGYIHLTEAFHQPAMLQFLIDKEQLYDYQLKNPAASKIIKAILRNAPGIFSERVKTREGSLANFLEIPLEHLQASLRKFHGEGIADYTPTKDKAQIIFLTERLDPDHLSFDVKALEFLRQRAQHRIHTMISYVSQPSCRSQQLLRYFGEADASSCGKCDACLDQRKTSLAAVEDPQGHYQRLKERLEIKNAILPAELPTLLQGLDKNSANALIDHWVSEGLLRREGLQIYLP